MKISNEAEKFKERNKETVKIILIRTGILGGIYAVIAKDWVAALQAAIAILSTRFF